MTDKTAKGRSQTALLREHLESGKPITMLQALRLFGIGNLVAFVVAIIAIRGFVGFLTKHGFAAFGWYRIILGLVLLALIGAGVNLSIL